MKGAFVNTILNQTLRLEYIAGDVTHFHEISDTGRRNLPYMVLSYQKKGSCRFFFKEGPPKTVNANKLIVIPAGITHQAFSLTKNSTYYWIHINYFVMNNIDLFSFVEIPSIIGGKIASRIGEIIKNWIRFTRQVPPDQIIRINAKKNEIGFEILGTLANLIKPFPENQSRLKYIHQIQPALDRIHQDYTKCIGRDDLAECCRLSASQFHRVFVLAMGITPMEYLRNLRIRRAKQLLITTDLTIGEITRLAGYNDPFIFSRYFKHKCGLSPEHYRRNIKKHQLFGR